MATKEQQKLRETWIKALETGIVNGKPYKKGFGQLKDNKGGLCCLGVAEMVAGNDIDKISENGGLCISTQNLFGFQTDAGCDNPTNTYESMAAMNDGHNKKHHGARSHKQIAAFVRKHPEKVWAD